MSSVSSIEYRVDGYRPRPVAEERMPGFQNYAVSLSHPTRPLDRRGVALWTHKGRRLYHPLVIARYGIALLHSYRVTQNPAHLQYAKVNARYLTSTAVSRSGALYFPYRFKWALFGNPSDLMRPPWFSAMAQGTALSFFVRLYSVTRDPLWRKAAASTFATFVQPQRRERPWTVFVDADRYLWFEEYAKSPPTQVLNGHIYALFGVYEYAVLTGGTGAMRVFDGGVTTVRHQINQFRVPGGISYYSLRVPVQYESYHHVHVGQLKTLSAMTGDSFFARQARLFAADAR